MIITFITLFVALTLSAVAAYYSIVGLTAIFAAAVVPIIVMGGVLEVAKITVTVWLHKNWSRTPLGMRTYLSFAVVMIMFITSMGIFGFLSKAHMDQGAPTGDVAAKLQVFDDKIAVEKSNIESNKQALAQMDAQVNELLGRTSDAKGANRAVQVRKQQAKDRKQLQTDIATSQATIAKITEERAPVASALRKAEVEVGPIKYIAALIYGEKADENMLESAVRWVIIIIVSVFDPLAVVMIVAANKSWQWIEIDRRTRKEKQHADRVAEINEKHKELKEEEEFAIEMSKLKSEEEAIVNATQHAVDWVNTAPDNEFKEALTNIANNQVADDFPLTEQQRWDLYETDPVVEEPVAKWDLSIPVYTAPKYVYNETIAEPTAYRTVVTPDTEVIKEVVKEVEVEVPLEMNPDEEHQLEKANKQLVDINADLAKKVEELENALIDLAEQPIHLVNYTKPVILDSVQKIQEDDVITTKASDVIGFGLTFPTKPVKGNMFLRTDYLPTKLYKYNGGTWIEVDKNKSDTYAYNDEYIKYLVGKISKGEYDPELLSDAEREQLENTLRNIEL
jgi:hypothetical protein